jgi:hypothetical protein
MSRNVNLIYGKDNWDKLKGNGFVDLNVVKAKCSKQERFKNIENMLNISSNENFDADESVYHQKAIFTYAAAEAMKTVYPEMNYKQYTSITQAGGPEVEKSEWAIQDNFGAWQLSSPMNNTYPNVGMNLKWFGADRAWYCNGMAVTDWEIGKSRRLGVDLVMEYTNTIYRTWEEQCQKSFWLADGTQTYGGSLGLLYNSDVNHYSLPNGTWASATADDIWEDLFKFVNQPNFTSYGSLSRVTEILMPSSVYSILCTTRFSNAGEFVIEKFKREFPNIRINSSMEIFDTMTTTPAGNSSKTIIVGLTNNPSYYKFEIPLGVTPIPVIKQGKFTYQGFDGVIGSVELFQPKSLVISEIN